MSREEILKVCEEGPEAVVKVIQALFDRIEQLKDQLNKNSQNSSKPPSTDGFKKPAPKSLREKGKHPTGGQTGHPGKTLCRTERPDQVVVHRVATCSCGHDLEQTAVKYQERRQVWDIPPLNMVVTEHQAQVKLCPHCGKINKAEFPVGVNAPVQYGSGANSLMSYLSQFVQRYKQILKTGFAEEERLSPQAFTTTKKRGRIKQSTGKNLLDRLEKYMDEYLRFLYDFRVPFDNNLAERDIRMMKVQQKISGTFRVKKGAEIFCRIRGLFSTLKKQSLSVMEGIRATFEGKAPLPPVSL